MEAFWLLTALLVKHYVCDFPLQRHPWLYSHKGEFMHPGGLAHAGIHGVGTTLVVWALCPETLVPAITAPLVGWFDSIAHWHIDFIKVRVTRRFKWSSMCMGGYGIIPQDDPRDRMTGKHLAIYSQNYFDAIGVDQLLHHLTYVALVIAFTL